MLSWMRFMKAHPEFKDKGRTVCGFSGYERQLSHRTPDKDFKKGQKGWSAKGE